MKPATDGDPVGAGVACRQQDGVRVGQEAKGFRQLGGRAAIVANRGVAQDVHAQNNQNAPGFACYGHDRLQDGRGRCHARRPGDRREEGLIEPRLAGAHLELGLARDVIQAVPEGREDPVVRQADGKGHGHAEGDAENGDQAARGIARQRPPGQQVGQDQEGAHGYWTRERRYDGFRRRRVRRCGGTHWRRPHCQVAEWSNRSAPSRDLASHQVASCRREFLLFQGGSIAQANHAARDGRRRIAMRREQNRDPVVGVQFGEKIEDPRPAFESRFPVGSSARRMAGRLMRARAMATRCSLAAGQLVRPVLGSLRRPTRSEQRQRALPSIPGRSAGQEGGQRHVLPGGKGG